MFPKVSVIVPVFNCEKFISKCLESILNQTYSNIEIILVNDGSFDRSEEIIFEYKEKDERIVYFYQDNSGPSEARNKGILESTGDFLVFIDSDDTVDKYYIELLLNKMINTGADLVCCGYKDISKYGMLSYSDFDFDEIVSKHSFMNMVCKGTGGVLWSKIYKKEIIHKNNIKMDKNIFMSEDLIFVLQYAVHCNSFAAIKGHLYHYNRLNEKSISSNISIDYLQNNVNVCRHIEKIFNSVEFHENRTNEIITKRIQDIVINLVEQQSINFKALGMKNAIGNVKQILSIQYVGKYLRGFSSNNIFYKPYIFLMKNNFVRLSIVYGIYLYKLKGFKQKIKEKVVST